jgi:hypothetical protein
MTPFEYVSVLISIILGLGITLILTGLAEIIKRLGSIKLFWPYIIWIILVFVLHLQEWWITYELKSVTSWSLQSFLFVVSYPVLLFVLANLLFPTEWSVNLDLKEFYFKSCNKLFICIIISAIISAIQNVFISGAAMEEQIVPLLVFLTFLILLIVQTRNMYVHAAVSILFLIVMIGSLMSDEFIITQ